MADKKSGRLIISGIAFAVFVAVLVIFILTPAEPREDIAQTWGYKPTPVYGGATLSQRFTAQADGLSAVSVQFGLYRPISSGVDFNLYEVGSGTALKRISRQSVGSARIANGEHTMFSFSTIAASKGRRYLFTIKAPELDRDHAVAVFLTGGEDYEKPYKSTRTLIDNKDTKRDMNFSTYCARSNREILDVFLSGNGRFAHVGGAVAFYLVMIGVFAAASRLIGLLATNGANGDKD